MSSEFGYGAAIDAGSSGSRIYLYRWPKESSSNFFTSSSTSRSLAKVEPEALFSEEITPGINDDDGIGINSLVDLVSLAKASLPSHVDPSEVPIYLGATAGMRLVDPAEEAEIMAIIKMRLHESGFRFEDNWARTLSGEEEGKYDWLVANYLKNDGEFPTTATTYGALDLGGASTQISFPVSATEDQYSLRIDTMEYPLYTKSFLYYGVDQARMEYDSKFASVTKRSPCYPTGYKTDFNIAGASNWKQCRETVAKLFDQIPHCQARRKEKCLIGGIYQDNQRFIAMSAFVYAWDFLGLKIGEKTDDLETLNRRAQYVCNLTHKQQMDQYAATTNKYLASKQNVGNHWAERKTTKPHAQCFNAAFSYQLLSKGYGLPLSKTPIEIHYDINGIKVQWALGLMLVEANKLTSIMKEPGQQIEYYGSIGDSYMYFLMISVAILIALTWKRRLPYRLNRTSDIEESFLPIIVPSAMRDNSSPRKGK